MNDYQKILLAVELSSEDDPVILRAQQMAKQYGSALSIIHVLDNIPMPDTAYGTEIPLYDGLNDELLEAKKARLNDIGLGLDLDASRIRMVWGLPRQEIIRLAEETSTDLIIVGSHGRHGLALLLGSTASGVLHHSPCDVLAVRLNRQPPLSDLVLDAHK
ncbi:MAG: universal stress protein [Nitrosomonadaceae bacterium]|jgi:universal stress protein A